MEFDADWIWIAVFVGVMLVRALGSMISRARRRATSDLPKEPTRPRVESTPETAFEGTPAEVYRVDERPEPIVPR